MNMSAPWVSYYHKLVALFGKDPSISIIYDNDNVEIKMYVEGQSKAEALTELLPSTVDYGNVKLKVTVIPANTVSPATLFRNAFEGNPVYEEMIVIKPDGSTNPYTYLMFKNEVVQYWDDNLGDPHGNISTLAQNIASEVFGDTKGVMFSTEQE